MTHRPIVPGVDFHHSDSIALMKLWSREGVRTKLLLSDPPYGARWVAAGQKAIANDENPYRAAQDFLPPMASLLDDNAWLLLFCRIDLAPIWEGEMRWLGLTVLPYYQWDKRSAFHIEMNIRREVLLVACRGTPARYINDGATVLAYDRVTRPEIVSATPTAKPVSMLRYLIEKYSEPGDLIIDPCAGIAPIGEAALGCGRQYLGVELEEPRALVATERLRAEARLVAARALHRAAIPLAA